MRDARDWHVRIAQANPLGRVGVDWSAGERLLQRQAILLPRLRLLLFLALHLAALLLAPAVVSKTSERSANTLAQEISFGAFDADLLAFPMKLSIFLDRFYE